MANAFIATRNCAPTGYCHRAFAVSALVCLASLPTLQAQTPPANQATAQQATALGVARRVLISELRASGPGGADDSFVELANVSTQKLEIGGWSLHFEATDGTFVVPIPAATSIPARGHLLLAGRQYSLAKIAAADLEIERAFSGVQLLDAQNRVVDAVGPRRAAAAFREGDGLNDSAFAPPTTNAQFSCVRRFATGALSDSDDNARDFVIVSTSGKLNANAARLGAPGPENLHSPLLKIAAATDDTDKIDAKKIASSPDQAPPVAAPVAVFHRPTLRDHNAKGAGKTFGTLTLRCRLVNVTDQPITRLDFRINGITNVATADLNDEEDALQIADVRVLPFAQDKKDANEPKSIEPKLWEAHLMEPPAQPAGGGFNSLISVPLPQGGLAPGTAGEMQCVLGIERPGHYSVLLDSEQFHITFDGDTEAMAPSALLNRPNLALNSNASSGTNTGTSARGGTTNSAATAPSKTANGANQPPVQTTDKQVIASATIVFEGNTEDEFEPVKAVPSPLDISSFRVQGGTIALRFGGALDGQSAADARRYSVQVDGEEIELERALYDVGSNTVSLVLPAGAVRSGDSVLIRWTELKDAQGRVLNGHAGPAKVP